MLSVVVSTMMMADDVTPEEALQQATQFVHKRMVRGNGPRLAPGVQPKLTLASRVSDLYVFNVGNDAGYVIVSNDDVAVPILGYSDSGSFDPNNIPDNMRAWLQGYADEIAWAKANHVKPAANAPMKAALGNKVDPLLTTYWDQGTPYNNLCPLSGDERTVTGCVATAMAQIMYYTAKKANQSSYTLTKDIPAYTTETLGINVEGIASGAVIDWSSMQVAYGHYYENGTWHQVTTTSEQDAAIANLMKMCGVALEMDYNVSSEGGSGAYSSSMEIALRNYFGYDETTQWVYSNWYDADAWAQIIYHEVSNGRPVAYSGSSSTTGHAFVCDGYKNESNIDLFHINWGWSGGSDGYFVLSALDPDSQGIGGGSSTDGYNSYQSAVIGIQLKGTEGSVSEAVGVSLRLKEFSISPNPVIVGSQVTITAKIANIGSTDYQNYIGVANSGTGYVVNYNTFSISSGETTDCVLTITPNEVGTLMCDVAYYDNGFITFGEEKALSVYPANVSGTMNQYGWATFSSECPLDFTNVDNIDAAYIVTGNSGTTINKTAVEKVPANTGLLLKGTINGAYTIPVTLDETDNVSSNKLVAVSSQTTVNKATDANTTNYVLSVQNDKVVFASINEASATVPAGRAYLTLTATAAPWFSLDGGDATGINEVRGNMDDVRDVFYDLSGRRVENPTKGVYIENGRKVVIK